jgi:hypothetical protein
MLDLERRTPLAGIDRRSQELEDGIAQPLLRMRIMAMNAGPRIGGDEADGPGGYGGSIPAVGGNETAGKSSQTADVIIRS